MPKHGVRGETREVRLELRGAMLHKELVRRAHEGFLRAGGNEVAAV